MTVSVLYEPDVYTGNGSLDTYPITFDYLDNSANIKVSLKNTIALTYTLCYEHLQYEMDEDGANIIFQEGYIPTANDLVIIEFNSDWLQTSDYVENSSMPAETLENDFDKLKLEVQALRDLTARALRVGPEVDLDLVDPRDYFDIAVSDELQAISDVAPEILDLVDSKDEIDALIAVDDDLLDIAANWTPASAAGAASLRFKEDSDNGTSGVYIKGPASLSGDITLTLPNSDGTANQVLITDGSGNLSWGDAVAGAAGSTYDIQYNDTDLLAGNSSFTTDGAGVVYAATYNATNHVSIGGAGTNRPYLGIYEQGPSGHEVRFQAGTNGTMTGNVTFTIPYALPASSGSVLVCSDAGVMSWSIPSYNLNSAWNAASTSVGASLDFAEGTSNGGNYTRLKASNSLSTSTTFTLPIADGTSSQVMKTDGSGNLGWVDLPSGGVGMPAGASDGDIIYTDAAGTGLAKTTNFNFSATRLLIPTDLTVYGKTSTVSSLNLYDADKSHTFTLRSPALGSNVILIAPDSVGSSNQVLITNGSAPATLSWSDATTLVSAASDTVAGKIEIAVQSEMEAGTDTGRAVTPGRQHFHPGSAKCWFYTPNAGAASITIYSYNVSSIDDNGAGSYDIHLTTSMSSVNVACFATAEYASGAMFSNVVRIGSDEFRILTYNQAGTATDSRETSFVIFGDM